MADILIREEGRAGRITLTRPKALNAVTWDMCLEIEKALEHWREAQNIDLVIIDAEGDAAFSAGGDLQGIYHTASKGDYEYGRKFWRDEYRLNAKIANYPKPYIAFTHGFTMGGGVGVSCHGSHRIVDETSKISMPECGVGLVPDVGGSLLLARAPGRCGEFLGLTGYRMTAADAIYAGFSDYYIPRAHWDEVKARLCQTGNASEILSFAETPEPAGLHDRQNDIDHIFSAANFAENLSENELSQKIKKALEVNSPISSRCFLEIISRTRIGNRIENALENEFLFTYRSCEHGDFVEGIRALIIDKDKSPKWKHQSFADVSDDDVSFMLASLGENGL